MLLAEGMSGRLCIQFELGAKVRSAICVCDHEKRDHRRTPYGSAGSSSYGECTICLCSGYTRPAALDVKPGISEETASVPTRPID